MFHYIINMMKKNEIMKAFKSLAQSQGFYGRIVDELESMSESNRNMYLEGLEKQNFKDAVDLVMFMES